MTDPNILGMMLNSPDGDPLAALRAAQEKLKKEEEAKKAFEELLVQKANPNRLDELRQQISQPQANSALDKLVSRVEQGGPLDDAAKITPQELERQMYERVWGAPAKSKLGKVGKGVSEVLGMFSGLPKDFSKPAMEQFLKIQQQHRMAQTADLNALSSAANTTQRTNAGQQKTMLDFQKLLNMSEGQVMKYMTDNARTANVSKMIEVNKQHYQNLDANSKEKIRLQAEELKNKMATNPFAFSEQLAKMPEQKQAEILSLFDIITTLQGANRGGRDGAGSTSVSTTMRREADETGQMQNVPITTTRQTVPVPGTNAMQGRAQGIREQLAQRLGMPGPIAPTDARTPPFLPPGSAPSVTRGEANPTSPDVGDLNLSNDTFRLQNAAPKTYSAAGSEKKKAARTQMIAFNNLVTAIVRGAEDGTLDKVAGGVGKTGPLKLGNQPVSTVTRFLHDWKLPGKDLGEGLNASYRRTMGTYAEDPKAQNLFEDITNNRVDVIANKVLEMSGKAATDQERAFLNIPVPHITDDPRVLVNQTLRKALRMSAIIRLDDLGLRSDSPEYYKLISEIGGKADDMAIKISNQAQQKKLQKLADKKGPAFSLDDVNPDRLIYETLKEKNMLGAFPSLRLGQSTPTKPTKQLQQKLKGLSMEQRLKSLGL